MDADNYIISQIIGRGGLLRIPKDEEHGFNLPGCWFNSFPRSMSIHSMRLQSYWLSKNDINTCRSIQRVFCEAHHTPGLGTLGANLVVLQIDVRDGLVDLQCLGQGLEAATDQGWRLDFKRPTGKTLDLKSSDQRTFNLTKTCKSLWLKHSEPLQEHSRNQQ